MKEAYAVFDWKGILQERVSARSITSRELARKLGPFADEAKERLVLWRSPSFASNGRLIRHSCFAYYPQRDQHSQAVDVKAQLEEDLAEEQAQRGQSAQHRVAQARLLALLKDYIQRGIKLRWSFKDRRLSFPFAGNLLAGAVDARANVPVRMPTGQLFNVDIAIVGPTIARSPIILGAIEIEYSHEFDALKLLYLQSLGFPLFSLDVSTAAPEDLNDEWAARALSETTWRSPDGTRKSFIYMNDVIAPLFVDAWRATRGAREHRFFVFASDRELKQLEAWLEVAREKLAVPPKQFRFARVHRSSPQSAVLLESAGRFAGEVWREVNPDAMLIVDLERPKTLAGPLYFAHLLFARLVCADVDAVVAYRCGATMGASDGVWLVNDARRGELPAAVPFIPQRLVYPMLLRLETLDRLKR